jgi:RNA recognition motif-containing protein
MANKIYVGNMNYSTTDEGLASLFAQYGEVVSARVIMDKFSGRSKGFGFVEMSDSNAAAAAISALNSSEFEGRRLKVNEALEPQRRERQQW